MANAEVIKLRVADFANSSSGQDNTFPALFATHFPARHFKPPSYGFAVLPMNLGEGLFEIIA